MENVMIFFEEIGQAILSYVKETYSPGIIVLCIDPYIWNECTSEVESFSERWEKAKRNLSAHSDIAQSNNNIAKLALAAFQIQLMNDAKDDEAFNHALSKELGIKDTYLLYPEYYRRTTNAVGQTLQEMIFLGAQMSLAIEGYGISYPNYDPLQMGRPNCYVNFPRSQSLRSLSNFFRYSDCKSFWPQIWIENGWNCENADIIGFENEFKDKMRRNISEKYSDVAEEPNSISLINNYLYGFFSQIWNGSVTDSSWSREKYDDNKFEIFNFENENDIASYELRKNGIIQHNIPEHIFCKPKIKKNSIFKLDKEYHGYASQIKNVSYSEENNDDDYILFMKENDITQEMRKEGIDIYNIISSQNNIVLSDKIIRFHGLNKEIINLFNLRTGEPAIEYIGGLKKSDKSHCTICLDFAIPKLKVNAQEDFNLTIDGKVIEMNEEKLVDISGYGCNKIHHIRYGIIHKKFRILNQDCYDDFFEKEPTTMGWIIEKGKNIKIAKDNHLKGCRINGLVGYGINDNDYGRILYAELNRFNMRNMSSIGNACVESRRKLV